MHSNDEWAAEKEKKWRGVVLQEARLHHYRVVSRSLLWLGGKSDNWPKCFLLVTGAQTLSARANPLRGGRPPAFGNYIEMTLLK